MIIGRHEDVTPAVLAVMRRNARLRMPRAAAITKYGRSARR